MSVEYPEKSSSLSDSFHDRISDTLRWGIGNITKIVGVAFAISLFIANRSDIPNKNKIWSAEVIKSFTLGAIYAVMVTGLLRIIGDVFIYARNGKCLEDTHKITAI